VKQPTVYILASKPHGTLYIGVTSNLIQRIWRHREGITGGFTSRYAVKTLAWFEMHATMNDAIEREKSLKLWPRSRKIALIETSNPKWRDLWPRIIAR
jgi:putative endonuclease